MPCTDDSGIRNYPELACPCPGCDGRLVFTGPNAVNPIRALVFLECGGVSLRVRRPRLTRGPLQAVKGAGGGEGG